MTVLAVHRDPFSVAPHIYRLAPGASLADMAKRVRSLPDGWPRHDQDAICINGHRVPQALWGMVKPKPASTTGVAIEVTFHAPSMGGGDGGGAKQVLSIVASIALVAVSGGIASGAILGGFTGAAAAGSATFLSLTLAGGVSLVGSLLLSALAPTPTFDTPRDEGATTDAPGRAAAQGNVLEPNGPLPRVAGTHKVYPPFATEPLVYYDAGDEVIELLATLAGPHKLEDIRINGSNIDEFGGVQYEVFEGWPGRADLTLLNRYGRTSQERSELRGHTVDADAPTKLKSGTGNRNDALPQAKVISSRSEPDEVWIGLAFPQGLFLNANDAINLRVPIRLRIREKGTSTWIPLPELHFRDAHVGEKRATIKLQWTDAETAASAVSNVGWVEARQLAPGQNITPVTSDWVADSYFDADTGADKYVNASNDGTNDVKNVLLDDYNAVIFLDEATFPKAQYQIEITRGYAFKNSDYSASAYTIAGARRDTFHFQGIDGNETIYQTKKGLSDKVYVARASSVWNDSPVRKGDTALIAVRARNTTINQLSVMASGYVPNIGYDTAPDDAMTSDSTWQQNDTITSASVQGSSDLFFAIDADIPAAPQGALWEQGDGTSGMLIGFDAIGRLVLRAGNGAAPTHDDTARMVADVSEIFGQSVTIYGEVDLSENRVRAWFYDRGTRALKKIGEATAEGSFSDWAGTGDGAVGTSAGTSVSGEDTETTGAFNSTIDEMRVFDATLAPAVLDGWAQYITTSNPAPHARDALGGILNSRRVPDVMMDDAGLIDFRAACDAAGYEVNAVLQETSVREAMRVIAGAGYAQLYASDIWGVVRDYDRSAESPTQHFADHNSRNVVWSKGFADMPDGFRITFRDRNRDYETRQIIYPDGAKTTEQVTYEGLVTEAMVEARAQYDLDTAETRNIFYSWEASADAIKCRRGSLVGLQVDMLSEHVGSGRIVDIEYDGSGDVTAITLDNDVPILDDAAFASISDLSAVEDVSLIGLRTGAVIRRAGGTRSTHAISTSSSGARLVFGSAITADGLAEDDLVIVGPLNSEVRRLIVFDMSPIDKLNWALIGVPEAPELWT